MISKPLYQQRQLADLKSERERLEKLSIHRNALQQILSQANAATTCNQVSVSDNQQPCSDYPSNKPMMWISSPKSSFFLMNDEEVKTLTTAQLADVENELRVVCNNIKSMMARGST
uniref:Uncharacterized protein n=1 Tax=Ditylum brightwellii TaxID=49249 RepID=A0A6V2BDZ0_9STRA|mmetsp:Transcript_27656/g.36734  ORF Transcript_27656/g.36734 Transcript_27656/m.36734 type:complete len:116 (-) Transcript_27656:1102-1449(-)